MHGSTARRLVLWSVGGLVVLAVFAAFSLVPGPWLKTLVMGVGGPALVLAAPVHLVAQVRFRGRAVRAVGVVERCVDNGPDEPSCTLTVRYTALDGAERLFTDDRAPCRPLGSEVRILYDPAGPSDARLHRSAAAAPVTALVMALVGAVLSYFFWRDHLPG
ncbi:hypothetical protein GCM10023085_27830 [Actinomadura viridis]|uniref:Peptidoglycan/LPS O-acetylase OafA/YrhL n=1 Tax=Actinomadura viridis TaxID=58110 RepID=A0A931GL94_9ACTN|nr:DUF3592 domain-containing protein [Actinomadura viridis]MBG6087231.1 peptidoglycan/LPS O-acetylase OafA/YrhL [Actinomadura viridis]